MRKFTVMADRVVGARYMLVAEKKVPSPLCTSHIGTLQAT